MYVDYVQLCARFLNYFDIMFTRILIILTKLWQKLSVKSIKCTKNGGGEKAYVMLYHATSWLKVGSDYINYKKKPYIIQETRLQVSYTTAWGIL